MNYTRRIAGASWEKLGRIYVADGFAGWAQSHAYVPTPIRQNESVIRVYVAFLDARRVGRVGFIDIDASDPCRILHVSPRPCLDVGDPGMFDDNGVTPLSVLDHGGRRYLYYVGWQLDPKVRYHAFTGLAVSSDNGETFIRHSPVPVTDRSRDEPVLRSSPHVILDAGVWKMWYAAGSRHRDVKGKLVPAYSLRYLESRDGATWPDHGRPCLDCCDTDEFGLSRPFVTRACDGQWEMLFSARTERLGYRLGYASSTDGITWRRADRLAALDVSESGWDSEMICFASVVDTGSAAYLFYNGNGYGETGVGVAVARC